LKSAMDSKFIAEIAACVAVWYSTSAVANTSSRKLLTSAPLPIVLTLCQFITATAIGYVTLHVAKVKPYKPLPSKAEPSFKWLTVVYTTGFLFVNAGYVVVNVSLAETLRSAEPLVTVALALLFLKSEPVSRLEMFSMLPIVLGGVLSSLSDSSFSGLGLLFVCISNLSFSLRSMFTKKLRENYDGDAFNVFYHVSLSGTKALFVLLCVNEVVGNALGWDSYTVAGNWDAASVNLIQLALLNGVTYAAYNQASFYMLSRVRMVTHGVANACRRLVTILFSVYIFGNKISPQNMLGIALAVAGVITYAKAKDLAQKRILG